VLSFFIGSILSYSLPKESRWIGALFVVLQLLALVAFNRELRSLRERGGSREKHWLEVYDELATEDAVTIEWIASHGRQAIQRSIDTIRERTIGEDLAYNVTFGAAGRVGIIAIIGLALTNPSLFSFIPISNMESAVKATAIILMVATYFLSLGVNIQVHCRQAL
jgi:hypothetical protein